MESGNVHSLGLNDGQYSLPSWFKWWKCLTLVVNLTHLWAGLLLKQAGTDLHETKKEFENKTNVGIGCRWNNANEPCRRNGEYAESNE